MVPFVAKSASEAHACSMEAVMCDISALAYWRRDSEPLGSFVPPRTMEPAKRGRPQVDVPSAAMVDDLAGWGLVDRGNVCLLVSSKEDRRRMSGVHYIVQGTEVPAGSFVRTRGQVYVVAPELLFIQLARHLSLVELLEVGYELCGTYRMGDTEGEVVYEREPLTSVSKLAAYARRAKGMRGRSVALRATQWILDNSASPAETALAIMFKLPRHLGGYALGDFQLNYEIALDQAAARILGRDTIRPDHFWISARHPSEYDSLLFHSSREQQEYDERRRNAYMAMGMSVTVFRPRHLCNVQLMDEMVEGIRRNIGAQWRELPADYELVHGELFNEVFRYWLRCRECYGTGVEFAQRVAEYSNPEQPW